MPTLTLKFKENELNNYRLEKGKSLTIGRLESNDIIIENLAVSGMHAKTVQHKAMLAKAEEKKQVETSVLSFLTGEREKSNLAENS